MKVRDVMTTKPIFVAPETPFAEIAETLVTHSISAVPVVDEGGAVVGVVTENDLLAKEAYPPRKGPRRAGQVVADVLLGPDPIRVKAAGLRARDVMSTPAVTIRADATVRAAARRMLDANVKRLPVVDDAGRLAGVVSRHDILTVYASSDTTLEDAVRAVLVRSLFIPPEHAIDVSVGDGVVRLEGSVTYESDIAVVGNLVAAVDGVIEVDNRLLYREPEPSMRTLRNDPRNVMTR